MGLNGGKWRLGFSRLVTPLCSPAPLVPQGAHRGIPFRSIVADRTRAREWDWDCTPIASFSM
jgi:hypothetical protein